MGPNCVLRAPCYLSLGRLPTVSALFLLQFYSFLPTIWRPCHSLQPIAPTHQSGIGWAISRAWGTLSWVPFFREALNLPQVGEVFLP